jgi:ribose-phosphate pyrophosphokinase
MELHAGQIQGFFDIPVDNLFSGPVFAPHIEQQFEGENLCIVSPDVGGVVRARALARRLGADLVIIDKRREQAGVSEVMNVIGEVKDKVCIMVDDIVDSGGTLCNAAKVIKERGAKSVHAYVVHGVLSGQAYDRIANSALESLVITDSIPATDEIKATKNIIQLSVANLMGEAILRTAEERSISALFK